ncbi:unannotated protein [freshwater metagenome]|uniref:Unannotated protein n=1 Tax=freshwater metagenome TaxID=449393 RepID=A0A6J7LUU4_9ZZZZ
MGAHAPSHGVARVRHIAVTAWPDDENTIGASAALRLARFLFTAREVARALSVSTTPAFHHALTGDLPCRRIARLARYTTADVESFIHSFDDRGFQ